MKRTNGIVERDVAALIKHSHDLRRDAEELHRTADEMLRKAARLKEDLANALKQRGPPMGCSHAASV